MSELLDLPLFQYGGREKKPKQVRISLARVQRFQFDGRTFDSDLDGKRIGEQQVRVMIALSDQRWRTLDEIQRHIQATTGKYDPQTSLSARLRDIRKLTGSDASMESRRRTEDGVDGLWEYRSNVTLGEA